MMSSSSHLTTSTNISCTMMSKTPKSFHSVKKGCGRKSGRRFTSVATLHVSSRRWDHLRALCREGWRTALAIVQARAG